MPFAMRMFAIGFHDATAIGVKNGVNVSFALTTALSRWPAGAPAGHAKSYDAKSLRVVISREPDVSIRRSKPFLRSSSRTRGSRRYASFSDPTSPRTITTPRAARCLPASCVEK